MKNKKIVSGIFSIMMVSFLSVAHAQANENREYLKITDTHSKVNGDCYPETLVTKDKETGKFLTCHSGKWMLFDKK